MLVLVFSATLKRLSSTRSLGMLDIENRPFYRDVWFRNAGGSVQISEVVGPLTHVCKRSNRRPRQRELTGPNLAPDWVPTLSAGG
jgi:hypothetical protein